MSNDPNQSETNPFSVEATSTDSSDLNPYQPTSNVSESDAIAGSPEAIRRAHISHEASVKSIGTLYILGAVFMIPIGLVIMFGSLQIADPQAPNGPPAALMIGIGFFYLLIGIVQLVTAIGLYRLRQWARITSIVLNVFGLLGFPVGTLICGYFLYLLLSQKGQTIFSPEYADIVAQTPHVKYRTSIIVWILLAVVGLLLIFAFLATLFG